MKVYSQGPLEKRDHRQKIVGDTIGSAAWYITPEGPTLGTPVNEATQSTVRLSGVPDGGVYELRCHITGASGQEYDGYARIEGRKE